jgi:hypothetical protein
MPVSVFALHPTVSCNALSPQLCSTINTVYAVVVSIVANSRGATFPSATVTFARLSQASAV